MSSPISIGVIGCGYAAEMHLPAICSLKEGRLTALADSNPGRLQALASRYVVERRHLDWRELIHDPANQVIAVLTPPHLHFEMTLEAVRLGKHVMVEKPLVADLTEADRLIEETSSCRAKIIIAFNLRFHRQIRQLYELIRDGSLGNIEFVRGVATSPSALRENFPEYRRKRDLGGGVVIDLAVHYYDLWEHLLDTQLQHVTAMSRSAEGDDTTAFVGGRTASGILVSAEFSLKATEQHEIEVYGDRARARASLYRFDGLRVFALGTHEGDTVHRLRHLCDAATRLPEALRAASAGGVFLDSFRQQWRYFLDCIRYDRPIHPGLIEGRRSLAIALTAVRAADTGRTMRLE
jgi:predicted dehydrogenase